MRRKSAAKAKKPRKHVFDRSLEFAQKRLARAEVSRAKKIEELKALDAEIPKLKAIIRVFQGPISDTVEVAGPTPKIDKATIEAAKKWLPPEMQDELPDPEGIAVAE